MKKILSLCFIASALFVSAKDGFKVIKSDANSVTLEYTLSGMNKHAVEINGKTYYKVSADNCVPVLNAGSPQVLRSAISLALPNNAEGKIEILSSEFTEINSYPIAPSKGSMTRNIDPSTVPYSFGAVYSQNAWYPLQNAEFSGTYMLRNQKGINVSVYPVQANPVTNTIKVYSKITLKISYVKTNGTRATLNIPQFTSNEEKQLFNDRFINLSHNISTAKSVSYTPISEFGDMLVITHPTFSTNIIPFVNWKNQKGIRTTLVTSAATGTTGAAIKAYIQSFYTANPNLLYVLLVGDHEQLNSYNHGTAGSEIKWGDSYYGRLNGTDHYPEVMVGRFSSGNATDINTMVNRTLEYEKTPLSGNWYDKGIGIGSNEGYGIGDDNEPDWMHMRNIGNKLVATGGYSYYHEFYDSTHTGNDAPGNPNATMVTNTVNTGASIFLYCGHGSQNTCVTSNFSSSNVNAATNYGKYPFSIQVACNNGTFIGGTCFSEAFLRAAGSGTLGPKGAIASVGSSILMAWAEPMQTEDEIGDILSNQYVSNKKYTLGGLFYSGQMSMLDKYPTATGKEVMETWVMFGDPSCTFRSQNPTQLTATHDNCYIPGSTSFSFASSVAPGSYACISQNNQIVGTAVVTASNTTVAFTQTYNLSQGLDLTITGSNMKPYTSSILICGPTSVTKADKNATVSIESMIRDEFIIGYTNFESAKMNVFVYDLTGRIVASYSAETSASGEVRFNASQLSSSVYIVSIKDENNKDLKTVKVVKQ
ncbi:MAG: hypothetical protein K0S32_166 [Bacteroidetes bacterium]|jgi:gingipain R|nr:hypothetical protein [Bacteroidota bacterium]